jgi:ubiquinone/menaquinone biosynthesis C-methylase UbiE
MDYGAVAEKMSQIGEVVVERVGVEPGMELIDVGCGTGNATIPAARVGARVTGLDDSAELLAIARERAADAMVDIAWVEGDPAELPFEDGSFDRVISMFGDRSERVVDELRRVCRGRIALCRWTDEEPLDRRNYELTVLDG